jgi:hypothetical protein
VAKIVVPRATPLPSRLLRGLSVAVPDVNKLNRLASFVKVLGPTNKYVNYYMKHIQFFGAEIKHLNTKHPHIRF